MMLRERSNQIEKCRKEDGSSGKSSPWSNEDKGVSNASGRSFVYGAEALGRPVNPSRIEENDGDPACANNGENAQPISPHSLPYALS